ncbi:MAG: hypothetical protein AMXMBFR47_01990 [Planctomycetota bacterium]
MKPRTIQLIALVTAVALAAAASRFAAPINTGRADMTKYQVADPLAQAPPEYALAIQALGAFRGLLTNLAFIRAEQYKMEGKYYDAMQLASWITKLQPRFVAVWEFLSWNMAWNISVTTHTDEERWNWVYNGVKLVRDEGLRYNPHAVNLYKQLSWIFVNKMSADVDEKHMAYKRNWAWRMHLLLGPPPDPIGTYRPNLPFEVLQGDIGSGIDKLADQMVKEHERRFEEAKAKAEKLKWELPKKRETVGESAEDAPELAEYQIVKRSAYDFIRTIAEAPATLNDLYAAFPETRQMIADLRAAGIDITSEDLNEDNYWIPSGLAFTFFYPYRALVDPPGLRAVIEKKADAPLTAAETIDRILGVRAGNPAGEALVQFLQKKVLKEVYKLDPQKMATLVEIFGPMDWRGVDAHSLYWINEGLVAGGETISKFGNDKTNTLRQLFFSLVNLFRRNRIIFEPYADNVNNAYINFCPDLNFIEPMHRAYLQYGKALATDLAEGEEGAGETFRSGHVNFLEESIRLLYLAGRKREAAYYYNYLREAYGKRPHGAVETRYLVPIEEFVRANWDEVVLGTHQQTLSSLQVLLLQAFDHLADGDTAMYQNTIDLASGLHRNFNADFENQPGEHKFRLPDFNDVLHDVLLQWLATPPYNQFVTVRKAMLWRLLFLPYRQIVYDDIIEYLKKECEAQEFDVAKAFPEPPGMEEYRKSDDGRRRKEIRDKMLTDTDTPAQAQ